MLDEDAAYKLSEEIDVKVREINVGKKYSGMTNDRAVGKCFSCERSWIIRTVRHNDSIIRCGEYVMPHDVTECNKYKRSGELDIWDLIRTHNPVDLSKPDKVVGFSNESPETPKL